MQCQAKFLSTLSLRRATIFSLPLVLIFLFLSTLSLRRATRPAFFDTAQHIYFYPRSPCGERPSNSFVKIMSVLFLSTLSLRRATVSTRIDTDSNSDFYPRSPCGERLISPPVDTSSVSISIHALLAESDAIQKRQVIPIIEFLSTLSLRRATNRPNFPRKTKPNFYPRSPCGERPHKTHRSASSLPSISIHALLAESDLKLKRHSGQLLDFYPRSPCGERPRRTYQQGEKLTFLSTLSLRRATALGLPGWLRVLISIHALLAESDYLGAGKSCDVCDFYPRSPCGERHQE